MAGELIWSRAALDDLEAIAAFVARDSAIQARRLVEQVFFWRRGHRVTLRDRRQVLQTFQPLRLEAPLVFVELRARHAPTPTRFADITCCVPCDYVPRRSYPLFLAREVLQRLVEEFKSRPSSPH